MTESCLNGPGAPGTDIVAPEPSRRPGPAPACPSSLLLRSPWKGFIHSAGGRAPCVAGVSGALKYQDQTSDPSRRTLATPRPPPQGGGSPTSRLPARWPRPDSGARPCRAKPPLPIPDVVAARTGPPSESVHGATHRHRRAGSPGSTGTQPRRARSAAPESGSGTHQGPGFGAEVWNQASSGGSRLQDAAS